MFQNSFDEFAEKIISRGNITNDELEQIAIFKDITEWSEDRIDCHVFFSKIIYNYVKQSIREGHVPTFHSIPKTECPFVLNNNEVIIWIFNNVDFYQKNYINHIQDDLTELISALQKVFIIGLDGTKETLNQIIHLIT